MHAVRPEFAPAGEHDHLGRARRRVSVGVQQPAALVDRHRPVEEFEGEPADAVTLPVRDFAKAVRTSSGCDPDRLLRYAVEAAGQCQCRRDLEPAGARRRFGRDRRDPHRPVDGRAAYCAVAPGDDRSRRPAQDILRPRIMKPAGKPENRVGNPRLAGRGAELAQHGLGLVARPVDGSVLDLDRRAQVPPPGAASDNGRPVVTPRSILPIASITQATAASVTSSR